MRPFRPLAAAVLPSALLLAGCGADPPTSASWDPWFRAPTSDYVHVSSYDTTGGNRDRHEVAAGDSVVLLDLDGPGVIRRLWLTVASRDPHYLRRIALEMYWDDETEPSVRTPLGDFFGNGFDRRHYASLPMGVSSGGFFTYLPMPFRRHARIVARNGTGRVVDAFYVNADVETATRLPRPLATFHATWRRDARTTSPEPHVVLDAAGAGHFVGLSLNAESHDGTLAFLEGDERYFVDGSFRGQGTGTEDYFNAGWYFDQGEFAAPYHGLVVKDEGRARIAAYRWHLPDPVPFHDSIRVDLEHGHANEEVADYATVAYWYQTEPHRPLAPLPEADARRVLDRKIPSGALDAPPLARRVGDGWTLDVPVPRPDVYELLAYPRGGPSGGAVRARAGQGSTRVIELRASEPLEVLAPVVLDTLALQGTMPLSWDGPDLPAAVEARPVRRFARLWNVVGPFPNPQRIGTEYSAAVDSVYGPERDPDLGAHYVGPDGQTIAWIAVDGPDDGYLRLNPHFTPNDWVAAYAQTFLWSPAERDVVLLLGADDAHVLWVDGARVSERQGRHIAVVDDLSVPVHLRSGWNRVLLKVADLDGGWAFQMRVADPTGALRWSRDAR